MKIKNDRKIAQEIRQILNFLGEIESVGKGNKKRTKREVTEYEIIKNIHSAFQTETRGRNHLSGNSD